MARSNPPEERELHVLAEAIAVAVVAPGLFYIAASSPSLSPGKRAFLRGVGYATVLVDGYLLARAVDGGWER